MGGERPIHSDSNGFHEKALSVKADVAALADLQDPLRLAPLTLASIRTLVGRVRDDPVHDEFRPGAGAAI